MVRFVPTHWSITALPPCTPNHLVVSVVTEHIRRCVLDDRCFGNRCRFRRRFCFVGSDLLSQCCSAFHVTLHFSVLGQGLLGLTTLLVSQFIHKFFILRIRFGDHGCVQIIGVENEADDDRRQESASHDGNSTSKNGGKLVGWNAGNVGIDGRNEHGILLDGGGNHLCRWQHVAGRHGSAECGRGLRDESRCAGNAQHEEQADGGGCHGGIMMDVDVDVGVGVGMSGNWS
mmetsp:Transcript_22185/g.61764  ORF Transcript_22185/g.61764 Transcript_22185/m.61764 type:complete len:230 (+) Transcript_22185:2082-2771(+)